MKKVIEIKSSLNIQLDKKNNCHSDKYLDKCNTGRDAFTVTIL